MLSASIVLGTLAAALVLYVITGGADFGAGIVEMFEPRAGRARVRALAEKTLAPIWEANHIWLVLALVVVFVGLPRLHTILVTQLQLPLIGVLVGLVIRGTSFTFRHYPADASARQDARWSRAFGLSSLLVPAGLGIIAAALGRGQLASGPGGTFVSRYIDPWWGAFPLATGLFTVCLCGWLATVYLHGEAGAPGRIPSRVRRWTGLMLASGAGVTAAAWWEQLDVFMRVAGGALTLIPVSLATAGVLVALHGMRRGRVLSVRVAAGVAVAAVLGGYAGALYPALVPFQDGTALHWRDALAPAASLDALAWVLVLSLGPILGGLAYLYRVFQAR